MRPPAPPRAALELDVHGLRISVRTDWDEVADAVRRDFQFFERDGGAPDVVIDVERREPDYDALGEADAAFVTPRNVVYQQGARTIVDYSGRAVSVLERGRGRLLIQGDSDQLVHEALYLFLLSRAGEHLDGLGLTRVHALALSGRAGAVAVLLPSGGGKSTLALRALGSDGIRLLAEDTPLLDRRGFLHPFPVRLAINASDARRFGELHVHRIERMEFHPKLLLDPEEFRAHIESEPQPLAHIVIGRRALGRAAGLEELPRRAAVGPLLREAVVGVGVYQGMEFVLQRGLRDVGAKAGVATRRALNCSAAVRRARVWRLTLGRDEERNWETLAPLLR
ncbi:MAG: hypothetical protein QOE36_827 [Gaiellaceae bacterium]|jgi:hypothetical protein|nr:hypothetical protein [Gaiellaceae bacterium]